MFNILKLFYIKDILKKKVELLHNKLKDLHLKKRSLQYLLLKKRKKENEFTVFLFIMTFILIILKKNINPF